MFYKRSGQALFYPPLSANQVFGGLSEYGRQSLAPLIKAKHFAADEQIFAAREKPARIYILNRGRANLVYGHRSQVPAPICPVGSDQLFGAIEVLAEHNFETGLTAATPCDFDVIDHRDFVAFLQVQPEVCFRVATAISSVYKDVLVLLKTK